jgi:hypothetical protein
MTFCTGGRARCLARLFQVPVTILTGIVEGRFCGNLGVLGVATGALLSLITLVMALLAVLHRVGVFFVTELYPLVLIRRVKPGIVDGDGIRLSEDALQHKQRTKEQNRSNNGNDFSVHETLTSFLPLFPKLGQIIPKTSPLSRKKCPIIEKLEKEALSANLSRS